LQICHAFYFVFNFDLDQRLTKGKVECHIAQKGDPLERGHPSLVEFRLCSRFTWVWFPGDDWACREFGPMNVTTRLFLDIRSGERVFFSSLDDL
jgi:hypothetical protein